MSSWLGEIEKGKGQQFRGGAILRTEGLLRSRLPLMGVDLVIDSGPKRLRLRRHGSVFVIRSRRKLKR